MLYGYRAGFPWRDLPQRLDDWKNVHWRYSRWANSAVWQMVFMHLAAGADNEHAMIDRTIVRAHQPSADPRKAGEDQAIGRSRGGQTTKIHALTDDIGRPHVLLITAGNVPPPISATWAAGTIGAPVRSATKLSRPVSAT